MREYGKDIPATTQEVDETVYDEAACDAALADSGTVLDCANPVPPNTQPEQNPYRSKVAIHRGDSILDTYEVLEEPIESTMGRIIKVRHRGWNVNLAIKQPHADRFQVEADKERFRAEAQTWVKLGLDPHIVSCYYVRDLDGVPSIFLEWMEGGTLKGWIQQTHRKLPQDEAGLKRTLIRILDICIQMARGLASAQANGVVHRDIKPSNILLTGGGGVKIADFGVSAVCREDRYEKDRYDESDFETSSAQFLDRTLSAADKAQVAERGGGMPEPVVTGTPGYRSPEQSKGDVPSGQMDIYSFAVTVLEIFTGTVLWQSGSAVRVAIEDYLANDLRLPMPEVLKELLKCCLSADSAKRPNDFSVIDDCLLEIYESVAACPYPVPKPMVVAETADSLNNKALSFLDLGQVDEAEDSWQRALVMDPHHPQSLYNQALYLWRGGHIDDISAIHQLSTATISYERLYLLALLHLERGDPQSAEVVLDEALQNFGSNEQLESVLATMRAAYPVYPLAQSSYHGVRVSRNTDGITDEAADEADGVSAEGSAKETAKGRVVFEATERGSSAQGGFLLKRLPASLYTAEVEALISTCNQRTQDSAAFMSEQTKNAWEDRKLFQDFHLPRSLGWRIFRLMCGVEGPGDDEGIPQSALYGIKKFRNATHHKPLFDPLGDAEALSQERDIEQKEKDRGFLPGEWSPAYQKAPDSLGEWRILPHKTQALFTNHSTKEISVYDTQTMRCLRTFEGDERLCSASYFVISPCCSQVSIINFGVQERFIYFFDLPEFTGQSEFALCRVRPSRKTYDEIAEVQETFHQANKDFVRGDIAAALEGLKHVRNTGGKSFVTGWDELYARVTKYCCKSAVLRFWRSEVFKSKKGLSCFALSPDGKRIFTSEPYASHKDEACATIQILDARSGSTLQELAANSGVFALSPDGTYVLYYCKGLLCLHDATRGKTRSKHRSAELKAAATQALVFHPDGKTFIADGYLWDTETMRPVRKLNDVYYGRHLNEGKSWMSGHATVSPDGKLVAIMYYTVFDRPRGTGVAVYEYDTGRFCFTYHDDGGLPAFSADGTCLIKGGKALRTNNLSSIDCYALKGLGGRRIKERMQFSQPRTGPVGLSHDERYLLAFHQSAEDTVLAVYENKFSFGVQPSSCSAQVLQEPRLPEQQLIVSFVPGYEIIPYLQFAPDDSFAITGGSELVRWNFEWDYEYDPNYKPGDGSLQE